MGKLPSSEDDQKVRENIMRHIMSEEEFRETPYLDPNGIQWDIGYARTFHYGKTLPEKYKNMRVSEPEERKLLWDNFKTQRRAAQSWLENNGVKPSGRLLDQLGMMFYGSKGDVFRRTKMAQDAVEQAKLGDEEPLSIAAARFGRTAEGRPLAVLAKRRDAERAFFKGEELPLRQIGRDAVIDGKTISSPDAPRREGRVTLKGLDLFRGKSRAMPSFTINAQEMDDSAYEAEKIMGAEGVKRANEVTWNLLHPDEPMPEGFSANDWARDVAINGVETDYVPLQYEDLMHTDQVAGEKQGSWFDKMAGGRISSDMLTDKDWQESPLPVD